MALTGDTTIPIRVWIGAQLPPALARWLSGEFGVLASHVADEDLLRADDPPIFDAARKIGITALVTKDEDFVRLLEERGPPPQVVWVTVGNVQNRELRRMIVDAWPRVAQLLAAGEPLVEIGRKD